MSRSWGRAILVCMPGWLTVGALAVTVGGCAGLAPSLKSENTRLQAKVAELRAQARRDRRRTRDLKNELVVLKSKLDKAGWGESAADLPPELRVEVREPERSTESFQDEDAGDEKYVVAGIDDQGREVVYVGAAATEEPIRPRLDRYDLRSMGRSSDRLGGPPVAARVQPVPALPSSERLPAASGTLPRVTTQTRQARAPLPRARKRGHTDPQAEYKRYQTALRAGNHSYAVAGFRNFVRRFPGHAYADNAQYWLGEAFYDQKQFKLAVSEFERVIDKFPRGNKVPDALLKLAYCHDRLGNSSAATRALKRVIEMYPSSGPAQLAEKKLAQLRKRQ